MTLDPATRTGLSSPPAPRIERFRRAAILLVLGTLVGCADFQPAALLPSAPEKPVAGAVNLVLTPVDFSVIPSWTFDRHSEALKTFIRSCSRLDGLPADKPVGPNGIGGVAGQWRPICDAARGIPEGDDPAARYFFESQFEPRLVSDGKDPVGLFTGYYEAEIRASRIRHTIYRWPLYRKPADLVPADLGAFRPEWAGEKIAGRLYDGNFVPYPSRADIEAGALAGRGLELMYADSPIDVFFLQIQGSGIVRLDDGGVVRVGYAGDNGRQYVSIGKYMRDTGILKPAELSMAGIREWMRQNPFEAADVMNRNPRYIFFREIAGEGPIGAQGVPLTPGRSLAVDPKYIPLGVPIWLDIEHPSVPDTPLRRLVIAQDTGGAIKGAVRGDLFWGSGAAAGERAGAMKSIGQYFVLLPRTRSQ